MDSSRRKLVKTGLLGGAMYGLGIAPQVWADQFPSQSIKLSVAFTAGGPTDITMRVLADNASKILGQTIVVDNKPGAGGTLPAQAMQSAKPDGYSLAQTPLGIFRLPFTTNVNWDPVKDLSYIINITGYSFGIVVPVDSPFKTFKDFIAYAKANPGQLSYGSTGALTSPHLTMEDIAIRTGVQLSHIPYKGSADLMQSLLGGHIMAAADSTGFAPHVQSGKLRVLCTWGDKRLSKFPDAPTLKELGIPIVQKSPYGLAGPKGMDPAVVKKLHDACKVAMEMPNHREILAKYDQELIYMSSSDYRKFAEETFKREKAIIERLGLAKPS